MSVKCFDLDGNIWKKDGYIPPVVFVDTPGEYAPGYYICNEYDQLEAGPFATFEDAAFAAKKYAMELK